MFKDARECANRISPPFWCGLSEQCAPPLLDKPVECGSADANAERVF